MKNNREVLNQAIEIYGTEAQLNVAIEEFSASINDIWITQKSLRKFR